MANQSAPLTLSIVLLSITRIYFMDSKQILNFLLFLKHGMFTLRAV